METNKTLSGGRLNDVVDNLVNTLLIKATSNRNFFVNDIPDHLEVEGQHSQVVASVLGGLLSTVVSYARNSRIWLSAKLYGNVILVHVKNSNGFQNDAIEGQLQQLQAMAVKTRGSVGYTSHQNNITSVTFGFRSNL